jgi:hypothetical protein
VGSGCLKWYTADASTLMPANHCPLTWPDPGSSVRLFRVKINCRGRAGYAGMETAARCLEAGHQGVHVQDVGTIVAMHHVCIPD